MELPSDLAALQADRDKLAAAWLTWELDVRIALRIIQQHPDGIEEGQLFARVRVNETLDRMLGALPVAYTALLGEVQQAPGITRQQLGLRFGGCPKLDRMVQALRGTLHAMKLPADALLRTERRGYRHHHALRFHPGPLLEVLVPDVLAAHLPVPYVLPLFETRLVLPSQASETRLLRD
jgi:hypothetical protein